ncbi:DHH family phosphoesterase [[Mycoplasma] testudinis]|uniref:DHH family phosphoesterase n=1 Tax=[Mycoplasma] testudinis TaxID=33924 RepID=UPI0006972D54|nr:bifunctional oligoribonuclease/PAP phosphatase NrnA [[Mycoplasma] testudinis]
MTLTPVQKQIINKVKEFENITLYVHERPDFDALGSAFAFKAFLSEYFPDKKAYVMGTYKLHPSFGADVFPFETHEVDEAFLTSSLGIIFDTANAARVLTGRHKNAKELIRIDHHPKTEEIAMIEWVDPTYSSAAEMVGWFIKALEYKLTAEMAKYIYAGIITDTGRYLYLTSTPSTYELTSDLLKTGFNRLSIHDAVYNKPILEHKYYSYVVNHAKITPEGLAYVSLKKGSHKRFGIESPMTMVHALNNISGVRIWTALYYDEPSGKWKGSIRSRDLPINQFAAMFNGGGHKFASGFSLDNKNDFKKLINVLNDYLKTLNKDKDHVQISFN